MNQIYNKRVTVPGQQLGIKTMDQLHKYNNLQLYRKGFTERTSVGQNTINIQLSGTAKFLLGIMIYDTAHDPLNILTLNINNDTIIEAVSWVHLTRIFEGTTVGPGLGIYSCAPYSSDEFFRLDAPLSGNDSINVVYQATTGGILSMVFYYL